MAVVERFLAAESASTVQSYTLRGNEPIFFLLRASHDYGEGDAKHGYGLPGLVDGE